MNIVEDNKKRSPLAMILGLVLIIAGLAASIVTRTSAISKEATAGNKLAFAVGLIAAIVGIVIFAIGAKQYFVLKESKKVDIRILTQAALLAALCYIGFMFLKIDIPVGTEKTAFHLGNVFCVLGALLIGGTWGGMAGAVGMTIADLTSSYVTSAPKTFILKLCIGLIVGFVAHKIGKLSKEHSKRYIVGVTIAASAAGMLFNVVADPVVGYFYKQYIFGIPQDAALLWAKMGAITTAVNAVIAVVVASALYLALRPALKKSGLFVIISKKCFKESE